MEEDSGIEDGVDLGGCFSVCIFREGWTHYVHLRGLSHGGRDPCDRRASISKLSKHLLQETEAF